MTLYAHTLHHCPAGALVHTDNKEHSEHSALHQKATLWGNCPCCAGSEKTPRVERKH